MAQEVADAGNQQIVCAEGLAEKEVALAHKLHEGYMLVLQSNHFKIIAALPAWLKTAEEEFAKCEERRAQAQQTASQLNEWCLRKQGLLADDEWTKYSLDPVVFLVESIVLTISETPVEDFKRTMASVGSSGIVILLLRPQDLAMEASLISALAECLVIRVFLQWLAMQQYGWLLCITNYSDIDKAKEGSRLLKRILTSVACMTGACTQIPNVEDGEIVMTSCRHALLPHQRGQGFYRHLLTTLNIVTPGQIAGTEPQDFTMVEFDAGVAEVIAVMGQLLPAVSVADAKPRWIGTIVALPKCRSNVQRVEVVSKVIAKVSVASRRIAKRMLERQVSCLPQTVLDICRDIPVAPDPPRSLVKVRPIDPAVHIHPCSGGTFDADAAQPVERESQCSIDKFDMWLPDSLALLRRCQRDSVMVAPSSFLEGDVGLYPTRDFKQGDIICQGVSSIGKWESAMVALTSATR